MICGSETSGVDLAHFMRMYENAAIRVVRAENTHSLEAKRTGQVSASEAVLQLRAAED